MAELPNLFKEFIKMVWKGFLTLRQKGGLQ